MTEVLMSAESDEIAEPSNFSPTALIGFLLACIGTFSVQYVQVTPVAIIGGFLGAGALLLSHRYRLGAFSRILAALAVIVGVTVASAGVSNRYLMNSYEMGNVRRIADLYLESLSQGDTAKVNYLMGFPNSSEEKAPSAPNAPKAIEEPASKKAAKRLDQDPAHVEIRGRKKPAKWTFVGLENDFPGQGHTYKVIYRDDGQPGQPQYYVFVRKNSDKNDLKKPSVSWFVDKIESVRQ